MSHAAESARIRSLRPRKSGVDPWRPLDVLVEEERHGADDRPRPSMTVFLAGSECPYTCVYCDLWQYTLDEPTPVGALPRQIEIALESLEGEALPESIKLYNASNFFDSRAVPREDLDIIAGQLDGFRRVVVECHPRLVGASCRRFADQLRGQLEIAMGLETVHPEVLPRLNKQMTPEDFVEATAGLRADGIGVRAFVLLSPPFIPARESVDWTVRTVRYALDQGASPVSIIPMRGGNGEMERLQALGQFEPPTLSMLEEAMRQSLPSGRSVVLADLWDLEELSDCPCCLAERRSQLELMNRTGRVGAQVDCAECRGYNGGSV